MRASYAYMRSASSSTSNEQFDRVVALSRSISIRRPVIYIYIKIYVCIHNTRIVR